MNVTKLALTGISVALFLTGSVATADCRNVHRRPAPRSVMIKRNDMGRVQPLRLAAQLKRRLPTQRPSRFGPTRRTTCAGRRGATTVTTVTTVTTTTTTTAGRSATRSVNTNRNAYANGTVVGVLEAERAGYWR